MTVDELAQEIVGLDQKCTYTRTERERIRISLDTQGKALENFRAEETLCRARIDGHTAELKDKMRPAGYVERTRFSVNQAEIIDIADIKG